MEKKLLVVVLFIVLSTQEIVAVTRMCKSRSREFGGRCIRSTLKNCNIVCMHEEFQYGVCRMGRCYCAKSCGSSTRPGGKTPPRKPPAHGGTPPHQGGGTPPDQDGETPPDQGGETPPDSEGPPEEFADQFVLEEPRASNV